MQRDLSLTLDDLTRCTVMSCSVCQHALQGTGSDPDPWAGWGDRSPTAYLPPAHKQGSPRPTCCLGAALEGLIASLGEKVVFPASSLDWRRCFVYTCLLQQTAQSCLCALRAAVDMRLQPCCCRRPPATLHNLHQQNVFVAAAVLREGSR